ncbi:hypothetical protein [Parasphingopyxis marina]|uniref:Uncharacterized protein n=1 Tax=Parasphingopyxis marina TaxID=2761622 RepID=A0A842HY17_9SPHN|nr:hypothetical protein [Parasphingopyxis marina]MBC2776394.1 hypothetical protein [Parasphingopyxis marina]
MEFSGRLTIDRPGLVDSLRAALPDKLARDGFLIAAAVPLRAKRNLGWFRRLRRELRRAGGRRDFSLRMASAVRFEFPFGPVGEISYSVSIPHHGRVLSLFVIAATLLAYWWDGVMPATLVLLLGSGALGIALHYAMRKSVIRYLGLLPSQYSDHRLSMG